MNENGESDPSNEAQASEPCGSAMAMTLTESGGDPVVTKYYFAGGKRVAMDRDGVVQWLVGDHLGTTSLVLNADGTVHSEARHYPYGEERWSSGTVPTDYRFTGQRSDGYIKLTVMGARWYDGQLGRWTSPDTIIPDPVNPQSLNRYSYTRGNPVKFVDPSGHAECVDDGCSWVFHPISGKIRQRSPTKSPPVEASPYDPSESCEQALQLVDEFRGNNGPFEQDFDVTDSLTQDIMHNPAIEQFLSVWAEAGHPLPFEWPHQIDAREGGTYLGRFVTSLPAYLRAQAALVVTELGLGSQKVEGSVDAVDGVIGSLDLIRIESAGADWLVIVVENTMNWESGLRIPGGDFSLYKVRIPNTYWTVGSVVTTLVGGRHATKQTFLWWIPKR